MHILTQRTPDDVDIESIEKEAEQKWLESAYRSLRRARTIRTCANIRKHAYPYRQLTEDIRAKILEIARQRLAALNSFEECQKLHSEIFYYLQDTNEVVTRAFELASTVSQLIWVYHKAYYVSGKIRQEAYQILCDRLNETKTIEECLEFYYPIDGEYKDFYGTEDYIDILYPRVCAMIAKLIRHEIRETDSIERCIALIWNIPKDVLYANDLLRRIIDHGLRCAATVRHCLKLYDLCHSERILLKAFDLAETPDDLIAIYQTDEAHKLSHRIGPLVQKALISMLSEAGY